MPSRVTCFLNISITKVETYFQKIKGEHNMEFKLNEYHRNISDEEFVRDIKKTAIKLKKETLTGVEYSQNGKYHASTIIHRFGSWKKALELAELNTKGRSNRFTMSRDDVIEDVKRVAALYNKPTITAREYTKYGKYSSSAVVRHIGSWNEILLQAEMPINENRNFTDEELFEEIERIWIMLGRQPTTTDIKKGISRYSLQSYARRFGGWRGALQAFVNYINDDTSDRTIKGQSETVAEHIATALPKTSKHRTPREINLRLRFKVLQRDNFKCCVCGASPARDSAVILHVDHIRPWSKGGETTIDNLQTLCSKCNLGKSDLYDEIK